MVHYQYIENGRYILDRPTNYIIKRQRNEKGKMIHKVIQTYVCTKSRTFIKERRRGRSIKTDQDKCNWRQQQRMGSDSLGRMSYDNMITRFIQAYK